MSTRHLTSPAIALALASSLLALPALAQSNPGAPKPTAATPAPTAAVATKPDVQAIMKYSEDGGRALRQISLARVAIFNGDPKSAGDLITQAKASLAKAEQEAPTFKIQLATEADGKVLGTRSETDKAQNVPVDGELVLSEDFVPTADKRARIDKANEHFKNGKPKEALEELRLGDIAVMYNRAWMPLAPTAKHLDQAQTLMGEQKYYEANLALKAISDSITVDSVAINEAPKEAKTKS